MTDECCLTFQRTELCHLIESTTRAGYLTVCVLLAVTSPVGQRVERDNLEPHVHRRLCEGERARDIYHGL